MMAGFSMEAFSPAMVFSLPFAGFPGAVFGARSWLRRNEPEAQARRRNTEGVVGNRLQILTDRAANNDNGNVP
jgi:hypothetical protein